MRKLNILSILVLLSWKILRRWLIAGIPPMVVPCTDARIAANSNSLLSAVMLNFALPAVINIALTVPLKWPPNLSGATTDIWFSLSMKISDLFSSMTVLSWTVSSRRFAVSFWRYFINSTKRKILFFQAHREEIFLLDNCNSI